MYKFKSKDKFEIEDVGIVYIVENPIDCTNFDHLINHEVEVNGECFKVSGVEHFAIVGPHKKGSNIGLLKKYENLPQTLDLFEVLHEGNSR